MATVVYCGYRPGEKRVTALRPVAREGGHSLVHSSTARLGNQFKFRWTYRCECGARYTSTTSQQRAYRSFEQHQRRAWEEQP